MSRINSKDIWMMSKVFTIYFMVCRQTCWIFTVILKMSYDTNFCFLYFLGILTCCCICQTRRVRMKV